MFLAVRAGADGNRTTSDFGGKPAISHKGGAKTRRDFGLFEDSDPELARLVEEGPGLSADVKAEILFLELSEVGLNLSPVCGST
jgi:hypothetical protein